MASFCSSSLCLLSLILVAVHCPSGFAATVIVAAVAAADQMDAGVMFCVPPADIVFPGGLFGGVVCVPPACVLIAGVVCVLAAPTGGGACGAI